MVNHIAQSRLKIEIANEISHKIFRLCFDHMESQKSEILLQMGSILGDFVNNLRSAVNYTFRSKIDLFIIPKITLSERSVLIGNWIFHGI